MIPWNCGSISLAEAKKFPNFVEILMVIIVKLSSYWDKWVSSQTILLQVGC